MFDKLSRHFHRLLAFLGALGSIFDDLETMKPDRIQNPVVFVDEDGGPGRAGKLGELFRQISGWAVMAKPLGIAHRYRFPNLRATTAFLATLAELNGDRENPPDVTVRGGEVTVLFPGAGAQALSADDVQLAIELDRAAEAGP